MDTFSRMVVALVWLFNGLWCKLLGGCPGHDEIVRDVMARVGLPAGFPLLWLVGAGEVVLAAWVIWGRHRRLAAGIQTVILIAMNLTGILWGGSRVGDPLALMLQNLVFLTLVWMVGLRRALVSGGHGPG